MTEKCDEEKGRPVTEQAGHGLGTQSIAAFAEKNMAEYLSPGVYVEEFDSDVRPTEGVGTSTAGFIGVAERGPVEGSPRMITNFAEFIRNYGGYLPASVFGNYRFLAYAVEYFFRNGGSRCFVMRVAPQDAGCAEGAAPAGEPPVLSLKAKEPGL